MYSQSTLKSPLVYGVKVHPITATYNSNNVLQFLWQVSYPLSLWYHILVHSCNGCPAGRRYKNPVIVGYPYTSRESLFVRDHTGEDFVLGEPLKGTLAHTPGPKASGNTVCACGWITLCVCARIQSARTWVGKLAHEVYIRNYNLFGPKYGA